MEVAPFPKADLADALEPIHQAIWSNQPFKGEDLSIFFGAIIRLGIPNVTENLDLGPSQSPGTGRSYLARISNTGDGKIVPVAGAFTSARNQIFSHVGYKAREKALLNESIQYGSHLMHLFFGQPPQETLHHEALIRKYAPVGLPQRTLSEIGFLTSQWESLEHYYKDSFSKETATCHQVASRMLKLEEGRCIIHMTFSPTKPRTIFRNLLFLVDLKYPESETKAFLEQWNAHFEKLKNIAPYLYEKILWDILGIECASAEDPDAQAFVADHPLPTPVAKGIIAHYARYRAPSKSLFRALEPLNRALAKNRRLDIDDLQGYLDAILAIPFDEPEILEYSLKNVTHLLQLFFHDPLSPSPDEEDPLLEYAPTNRKVPPFPLWEELYKTWKTLENHYLGTPYARYTSAAAELFQRHLVSL